MLARNAPPRVPDAGRGRSRSEAGSEQQAITSYLMCAAVAAVMCDYEVEDAWPMEADRPA
jgi:hypothetical protein